MKNRIILDLDLKLPHENIKKCCGIVLISLKRCIKLDCLYDMKLCDFNL